MFFDSDNKLDKKITKIFKKTILKKINIDTLDYLGINITSDSKKDFDFKIYYKNKYSHELYKKDIKNPLIEYLTENKMMNFLTVVHDKNSKNCSRYDIGLTSSNDDNFKKLITYLENNCNFFDKYREEIIEYSKLKTMKTEKNNFSSLYFVAILDDNKTLKLHWQNRVYALQDIFYDNEHYINYIENCNIDGFKKLLPVAKKILKTCKGNLWMQGIDYSEKCSKKHKIYICETTNTYDGLIKAYSNSPEIISKISDIKIWNNEHPEMCCAGFAIGEDSNKNSTINFYYRISKKNKD